LEGNFRFGFAFAISTSLKKVNILIGLIAFSVREIKMISQNLSVYEKTLLLYIITKWSS
jgi:hypothetical protein